jgi:SAM-dependent methyltransferase
MQEPNVDPKVTAGFGDEWTRLDQSELSPSERIAIFDDYFRIFPWHALPRNAVGADLGCGSGRWAMSVAPRVHKLYCVDASAAALDTARRNLSWASNCEFQCASVESARIPSASLDFGYSLGVLHHTPQPREALRACAAYLKPGAPFLLYLYYRFDNRPAWFRTVWALSDVLRRFVSRCPHWLRYFLSQVIAAAVYWPIARTARVLAALKVDTRHFPLRYYSDKSFYVMRTDALDRFGTTLEHRFTQREIRDMMEQLDFRDIEFSDAEPFWCAVGYKA